MKASVIIPTRNRCQQLATCLDSLTRQSLPRSAFEVLVIDNGSSDETADVASCYQDKLQLRYLLEPEPGLHAGRHAGLRHARSDILTFCDDDIIAEPIWIESVVQAFSDPKVALVCGNNLPLFEQPPPGWLLHWWNRPVYRGHALGYLSILDFGQGVFQIDPGYVWGCNYSIRKQMLINAGGFHPDAMPDDQLRWRGDGETHVSNAVRQSGMLTLFHSGASVGHRVPTVRMSTAYFARRGYAQGISDSYTDLRRSGGARSSLLNRARRRLMGMRSKLQALLGKHGSDVVNLMLREVQMAALGGYRKGYDFHQREVAGDQALLSWVLKENYF